MLRASAIALLLLGVVVTTSIAANPHFITGPTFSAGGGSLTASGKIAGLGNQDVTIQLTATGVTTCTNKGNNVPPGQTETVSGTLSDLRPENGAVSFRVTTASVSNPCPDGMRPRTTFTKATLTVYQAGRIVLQQSFAP